jgi:hypothetical protein
MAIIGLERFADFFKGYEDCYTIIGGTACDIKAEGRHVNEKDLRKHKNDVFHLLQIIPADETVR